MPKYGYARVSTAGQSKHGNSLEGQVNQLLSEGVDRCFTYVDAYTCSKMERPKFTDLFKTLQVNDVLVVTKLDRFARSSIEGIKIIDVLIKRGVRIHILNIGILDNTPTSMLIRNILMAIAEFERELIIERTQAGKEIARQKEGFRDGCPPKFTKRQMDNAVYMLQTHSMKDVVDVTRISKSTIKRELKKRRNYNGQI